MFRNKGNRRTFKHNLQLAIVLSFVAGIVNVVGFLALSQLTTNVTGHFALFINDVSNFHFWRGTIYFAYIGSFFLGSFVSNFLMEISRKNKSLNVFVYPIAIESLILLGIAIWSGFQTLGSVDVLACLLLFSMGLQNSYVTKISNTVVRTTHLTGLFTDLGIETSQLFFSENHPNRKKLKSKIQLRVSIISFFFLGGLVGGFLYSRLNWQLTTLAFAAFILIFSLFYDVLRLRVIKRKRKVRKMAT